MSQGGDQPVSLAWPFSKLTLLPLKDVGERYNTEGPKGEFYRTESGKWKMLKTAILSILDSHWPGPF